MTEPYVTMYVLMRRKGEGYDPPVAIFKSKSGGEAAMAILAKGEERSWKLFTIPVWPGEWEA